MKHNLIVARCGDNSLHPHWLAGAEPNFDLVVTYFGEKAPEEWLGHGYPVISIKGPKWKGLYEYLSSDATWKAYERILLPDDDLLFDAPLINRFFDLAQRYEAELSQPALDEQSYFSHPITLVSKSFECRVTNFVETMCPCFSPKLLQDALPLFPESNSGWGMEFYWVRYVAENERNLPMIFDGTPITHTRPVGQAKHGTDGSTSPHEEIQKLFEKYDLVGHMRVTLAGVLKNGEMIDGVKMRDRLALHLVRDALAHNERMDKALFAWVVDNITADIDKACPWLPARRASAVSQLIAGGRRSRRSESHSRVAPKAATLVNEGKGYTNLADHILERTFRFGRIDGSEIGKIQFMPDGTIVGYQNPNERFWAVKNGALELISADGVTTTRFNQVSRDGSGYSFIGEFLPRGPGAWHTLNEVTSVTRRSVITDLESELYGGDNPLSFAEMRFKDDGYPHTNVIPELIESIVETLQPRLWLELGSMVGGSAIRAADVIKSKGLGTEIVCVDPFTGDVNMWAWEQPKKIAKEWQFLRLENGKPTIYQRFLANVVSAGHADIIIPIAATSIVGIKLLKRLLNEKRISAMPTVIYLDSAHEPEETFLELQHCWSLLEPGGLLMGDDWGWDSVRNDVLRFSRTVKINRSGTLELELRHKKFTLEEGILLDRGQWVLMK